MSENQNSFLFTIEYKNLAKVIHEEKETYTLAKFQADLGGAAGLVLGINITMLLILLIKFAKQLKRYLTRLKNRLWIRFEVNVGQYRLGLAYRARTCCPIVFRRKNCTETNVPSSLISY